MDFKKKNSQGPKLKRDIFARISVIFKPCFLFTWWWCLFSSQFWLSRIWRLTERNNFGMLAMFLKVLKILWFYMIEIQCNQLTRVLDNVLLIYNTTA